MKIKVIVALAAVFALAAIFAACGSRKQSPPSESKGKQEEQAKSEGYIIYINEDSPDKFVMYSVDTKGKNKKKIYDKNPYSASGQGPQIGFVSDSPGKSTLYTIKGDAGGLTPVITDTLQKVTALSWSPDGKRVVFAAVPETGKTQQIFHVEAGKYKTPVAVTDDENTNMNPKFSNDGRMIVYEKLMGGSGDIYKFEMSSKKSTNLTGSASDDMSPVVTPDGTKILFLSDEQQKSKYNLYMMNIDGGDRAALTTGMNIEAGSIKVSPDSSMVAFVTKDEKDNTAIQVVDMHKSTVLAANGGYLAAWSGDSKMLYFASSDPKNRRIVEYDIAGGTMKDVLNIEYKPGEDSSGIKFLHFTNKLK